jgi:2,4-dienoyl-CoA reductase-like NADH-dependent reductase (Old Yellow Enzyme family)
MDVTTLTRTKQFAINGVGAIMVEATAILPEGRTSPKDNGIWTDSQIAPLKRVVDFVHAQGAKIGIQLAHAGRKASMLAPSFSASARPGEMRRGRVAKEEEGGWPDEGQHKLC